ncbi:hypothetical protein BGX33_007456 [Mortierella sp. NVP41]|nr:hypothetical protein BGX33_007456 [Mortierella sp. NVP41]
MQRTSSTSTSTTETTRTTASLLNRARATATTSKGATLANTATASSGATILDKGESRFGRSLPHTTQRLTTAPSRPTNSLIGGRSFVQSLRALSTLSSTRISTGRTTSKPPVAITANRPSFGDTSYNPFLDQRPEQRNREQFKSIRSSTSTSQQTSLGVPQRTQEAAKQPRGLVLTRVLPVNSPSRIAAAAAVSTQDAGDSSNHHPSGTTPKLQPKADYYHFLNKSTALQDVDADEESDRDAGGVDSTLKKSLRTTAMDIARRSIMQHSTASPHQAFMKVAEVAAHSHGKPSLHDLLAASETDDDGDSRPSRPAEALSTQSFAHPDTPFTFESTPLPPLNQTTAFQQTDAQQGPKEQEQSHDKHHEQSAEQDSTDAHAPHRRDHSEPSSKARASVANRTAPYRVPTVNEREALRSSRAPGFRARPVDPRVFTSAGDLGVPRIKKQPLTIPVSPVFSKPRLRSRATTATAPATSIRTGPVRTAAFKRLVNITRPSQSKIAATGDQARGSSAGQRKPEEGKEVPPRTAGITQNRVTHVLSDSDSKHIHDPQTTTLAPSGSGTTAPLAQGPPATLYPSTAAIQQPHRVGSSSLFRPPTAIVPRKTTLGPPLRGDGPSTTIASTSAAPATGVTAGQPVLHSRRPLTQPVPFKFATDDILRRRNVMFQSRGASRPAAAAAATSSAVRPTTEKAKPASPGVFRRDQPLKRLTVPVPFRLATQQRAEVRPPERRQVHTQESAAQASIRTPPRRSRLAGLFSVPVGHPIMTKPAFVPTKPISPKFGRRVPVRSLRPTQFVLKKSTKELTQPQAFEFHSDQRAMEREEYERQQSEREQRMRMRESLERTFRARPIIHYQPTIIHKATRPLTKPVSPMIGEKRKRHEMEMQYQEQQRHEQEYQQHQRQQQEYSQDQHTEYYDETPFRASSNRGQLLGEEVYRAFEEAKILQARQQALQQQLSAQERRQVVLANSARATIHQPPIRLSFPMDPATETLQADEIRSDVYDHKEFEASGPHEEPSSSSLGRSQPQPLPQVRDSFGGSNNHRLSRELRRISFESRRTSGGRSSRSRLSDTFSRNGGSSGGSRKSAGGGEVGTIQEYYPFTRSQEPTSVPLTSQTATRTIPVTTSITVPATTSSSAYPSTPTYPSSTAATISTTLAATPAPLPIATTSTTAISTTPSVPPPSTRTTAVVGDDKDERRRRSGSFIPLEPVKASPPKSSRLSRLFGAPPVSSASSVSGPTKELSVLSRSKGPVVIEHTLSVNDL